jgi:hypothetical protein
VGWKVFLIRMPVGSEMKALEQELPPDLRFSSLAGMLGVRASITQQTHVLANCRGLINRT